MNMADNDDNEMLAQVPVTMLTEGGDRSHTHFKLPPFWQRNPGLWFAQVECVLCVVSREFNEYCLIVEALHHDSLCLVADLVEQVLTEDQYTTLKGPLMLVYQLKDFQ